MKNLLIFIFILTFYSCTSQPQTSKIYMEKFNITLFRSQAVDDEYVRVLSDSTIVDQMEISSGFIEKTTPPKGWFYEYKEYYSSGQLKSKGKYFLRGDYQAGLWITCDEKGNITSQIDYDKLYKLTLDSIFEILEKNEIPFERASSTNQITRNIVDKKATWFIQYRVLVDRTEVIQIDDANGQIIKRTSIKFKSRN